MPELKYIPFCVCDTSEALYDALKQEYYCLECNELVNDIGSIQISDAEIDAEQLGHIDNAKLLC